MHVVESKRRHSEVHMTGKTKGLAKLPVSKQALILRIKRQLSKEDATVRAPRGGVFYVVNEKTGAVVSRYDDIAALARELGVLAPYENVQG